MIDLITVDLITGFIIGVLVRMIISGVIAIIVM